MKAAYSRHLQRLLASIHIAVIILLSLYISSQSVLYHDSSGFVNIFTNYRLKSAYVCYHDDEHLPFF